MRPTIAHVHLGTTRLPDKYVFMALLRPSVTLFALAFVASCQRNPAPASTVPASPPAAEAKVAPATVGLPPKADSTARKASSARPPAITILATEPMVLPRGSDVAPTYSPEDELARMHPVDGYRVELVASEPLVQDPIAVDFDADGRMYVVEMRGFMPNVKGTDEDRPVGRIVVVEDTNHDGVMDRATVFLDSLVMPRAIKVTEHGVLVAAPPNLWLVRDTTGDLQADTRQLIRNDYGNPRSNPEHQANGLLWGIDNWIHNANYPGEFRIGTDGKIIFRKT
ncbi:MAG: hypothetical protein ABI625_28200, partial [bacterium]